MGFFSNLDLLAVGVAVAATTILGVVVFYNNRTSITNRYFLYFSLSAITWTIVNYLSYQFTDPILVLWLLRFEIFCAVWLVTSLYFLLSVVPNEKKTLSAISPLLIYGSVAVSLFTLSPFVFIKVLKFSEGRVSEVQNGPGIAVFGIFVISVIIFGIYTLVRKIPKSTDAVKKQLQPILIGIFIMFTLLVTFNFILPAFLNNPRFVPLGGVFIFPFIVFTSYAIIARKLLNIKVLSTEILVFVLGIATFIEIIISTGWEVLLFRSSIFLLVLSVGVLLIRSVIREVKQREELEVLSKELAAANVQLKALDQARAEFISIASHQLRTPPATIKWYVGAILHGDFGPLSEDLKAALLRTNVTNESQISTIDDLLNASRIERGKLEFFFEKSNLEPVIRTLVEQLEPLAQMKKQHIVYTAPAKPIPDIMMDHEKIRQVVNNMIDNAIKYSKLGDIHVDLSQDSDNIIVRVKDTGKGIEPSELSGLFQKYSRGKDSATHATGLGLGMYVAKVIVEQHHGKIWAESDGIGKGATFAFSLPIHSENHATSLDLTE